MYIFVSRFPRVSAHNSTIFHFASFAERASASLTKREPPFLLPPSTTLSLQRVPWLRPLRLPLVHVPVTIQPWTRNICPWWLASSLGARWTIIFNAKRGTRKNSGEPFSRSASTIGRNEFGSSVPRGIDMRFLDGNIFFFLIIGNYRRIVNYSFFLSAINWSSRNRS